MVWNVVLDSFIACLTVNAVGFVITATTRTHKITDLFGASTFALATIYVARQTNYVNFDVLDVRTWAIVAVCVWAARLGIFLFSRVLAVGEDKRLRKFFPRNASDSWLKDAVILKLAFFWTLQSLWAFFGLLPITLLFAAAAEVSRAAAPQSFLSSLFGGSSALATSAESLQLSTASAVALAGFVYGFVLETVADAQKNEFRRTHADSEFCDVGVWRWARFPNYGGEMVVWISLFAYCAPFVYGNGSNDELFRLAVSAFSPLFVIFLLTRVSGVPMTERAQQKKYGGDRRFIEYTLTVNKYLPGLI